jgi:hypothetical protein
MSGLRPVNLIGGLPFAGATREFRVAANNAAAIFNGDLVVLSTAGQPSAVTTTPTAGTTAGIVGVMQGARYLNAQGQLVTSRFLPVNTISGGGSDVWIQVCDDPNTIYRINGTEALGTFNSGTNGSGWPGAIGKNSTFNYGVAGSTATGNSGNRLTVGTNGGTLATTAASALRIIDVVRGTETTSVPQFLVKLNVGVLSYDLALGV